jgi:hypothetical protein
MWLIIRFLSRLNRDINVTSVKSIALRIFSVM